MESTQAGELLGTVGRVSRAARRARHGYWFPLLLFGMIILGALPFYRYRLGHYGASGSASFLYRFGLSGGGGNHPWGASLFWLLAVPLGYLVVAAFYRARARRMGVQGRIGPFIVAGLVLFALLLASSPGILALLHAPRAFTDWQRYLSDLYIRGLTPILVVSIGFFVLARLERSWTLFSIALLFLPIALLANLYNISNAFYRFGHWIVPDWAANIAVAGGFLVFAGVVSFVGLHIASQHHEPSR